MAGALAGDELNAQLDLFATKLEMIERRRDHHRKKFLFVIFQRGKDGERHLAKVFFWNMPTSDLNIARHGWIETKNKISRSDLSDLLKKKVIVQVGMGRSTKYRVHD